MKMQIHTRLSGNVFDKLFKAYLVMLDWLNSIRCNCFKFMKNKLSRGFLVWIFEWYLFCNLHLYCPIACAWLPMLAISFNVMNVLYTAQRHLWQQPRQCCIHCNPTWLSAICPLTHSSFFVTSQRLACKAPIVHYQRISGRAPQENQPACKVLQASLYIIRLFVPMKKNK